MTIGAGLFTLSAPSRAGEDPVTAFLGAYQYAGGDKERKLRDKAIDDVVAGMNVIIRGIARDKLKAANPIADVLAFAATATNLTVKMDARSHTGPRDGGRVKVKGITGDELEMRYAIRPLRIDQIFTGEDKGRTNAFSLAESTVAMRVRVHSTQLPKDLVYTLTYTKK
mgnify:CR=1 FL=1